MHTFLAKSRTLSSVCRAETRRKTKIAARDMVAGAAARCGSGGSVWSNGHRLLSSIWLEPNRAGLLSSCVHLDKSWPSLSLTINCWAGSNAIEHSLNRNLATTNPRKIHGALEHGGEEDGRGDRRRAGSAAAPGRRLLPGDLPRPLHLPPQVRPPGPL